MTAALVPLIEASPAIIQLAIPRLAPVVATVLAPQIVVPLLVVGTSYAALQVLHSWSKENNEAIQAKAKDKYCALNSDDPDCQASFTGGQSAVHYRPYLYYEVAHVGGDVFFSETLSRETGLGPILGVELRKDPTYTYLGILFANNGNPDFRNYSIVANSAHEFRNARIVRADRVDGQSDPPSQRTFADWAPAKQQTALQQLTTNDWKEVISQTSSRPLSQGEAINSPVILTGDPTSAIPQERVPRTINFPGEVPAVAANPGIYIPASSDNTIGISVPGVQNIPNINQGESTRIQTQTGYIEVSPTGELTIVGSPSAPAPATAAPPNIGMSDIWGELQGIKNLVGLTPLAVGVAIAPAMTRVPNLTQVGSAAETATCSVVSGKSPCSGNPLPGMNSKLDDLINGLGLAGQAGQGALLQAMNNTLNLLNTKVGNVAGIGSLATGMGNIMSHAGVGRVMDAVTMVGVIHNAAMLSNNLDDTLFQIIDNVLAIPTLIVNPKAETVDSQEVFGKAADDFFKGLFGVTAWTEIKTVWKSASTIYSTGANTFDNLRSIHSDSQDILNTTAGWTAQLGNALQNEGLIGEDNWEQKPEKPKFKSKTLSRLQGMAQGIEALDNGLQAIEQVTQNLRSIVETANEIKENVDTIDKAVDDGVKAATKVRDEAVEKLPDVNISLGDLY